MLKISLSKIIAHTNALKKGKFPLLWLRIHHEGRDSGPAKDNGPGLRGFQNRPCL